MADELEEVQATEETPEARDLIDELIDDLNDGVPSVTFDRDVLDTDRPDDWGAVELTGQDDSEWADGHLIEQVLTVDIWVCVTGRGSKIKRDVQKVLRAFGKAHESGYSLRSRNYLYDLDKVMWRWVVTILAPLAAEPEDEPEEPEEPEEPSEPEEPDDLPFEDPEDDPEADPEEYQDPEWPEIDEGNE